MLASWGKRYFGLLVVVLLLGCKESETNKQEVDVNPETVIVGQTVTLTAPLPSATDDNTSRNKSTNVPIYVYAWSVISKPAGSAASLINADTKNPSFVADFQGTYIFKSSVFDQGQVVAEKDIEVLALPQDPSTSKPEQHIASNDICDACHVPESWKPGTVDHNNVIGQCYSCHQKPAGHIESSNNCVECHDSKSWAADRALFNINKALWDSSNIASYQFTYRCSCLPEGDIVITVAEGVVTEAIYVNSGTSIPAADLPDVMTISKLFDVVDAALQSGTVMTVNYNPQYGFPQSALIGDAVGELHSVFDFQVDIPPQVNPDQVQLNENRLLWQQAGLTDYQYTYRIGCFCPFQEDIVVVVKAGVVVEAHFTPSGTPLTAAEIQSNRLRTVEQLFDVIQSEIDRPAARLTVTYDSMSGYPQLISVDPFAGVIDEEYSISVMDLQDIVVPPENPLQTALDANKALWQLAGIAHYQYTYNRSCFLCDVQEDIVVEVNAGIIVAAHFTPSGTVLSATDIVANNLKTVEQWFAYVQSEIDLPAAELIVTYNSVSGYPQSITVDPSAEIFDDRITMTLSDLQQPTAPPSENPLQTALDENRVLWQQANLQNYQYTYNKSCFLCIAFEDIVVVVNAGVTVEAYYTPSGTPLTFQQIQANNIGPVENFFSRIQSEIDRPAAELLVTYNSVSGYPEVITVDPFTDLFDDRYTLTITNLQKIEPAPTPENTDQVLLNQNKLLWQQAGLTDYQYTYHNSCLCPPNQVVVTVRAGVVTEAFYTGTGAALTPEQIAGLPGIEGLFGIIQDAIDRNVPVLTVTYNADYGYPEQAYIDYFLQVVDEEAHHVISSFQVLN